jgi:peptide/nickel transport system substrate-binding protein
MSGTKWLVTLILALVLSLSACGQGEPAPAPEPTEAPAAQAPSAAEESTAPAGPAVSGAEISEKVATQAVPWSYPNLDPDLMLTYDHSLAFQAYETLTLWDPVEGVLPRLATSWESNPEGTVWTFHLREGVTFHDGTPFTAEAVKFSYERTIEFGLMAYYFDVLESIEVVDDHTIRLTYSLPRPAPTLLAAGYGMFIVNPNIVDKPEGWFEEGNDAGTGPYQITSVEAGTRFVLERYPDYWGGWEEGQFTKLVYLTVEDPTVREQMIRSGEADMTNDIPFDSHDSLVNAGQVTVDLARQFWNVTAAFHLDKPPMDDPLVRQALIHAFPYEMVQAATYAGTGRIAKGIVPDGLWRPPADLVTPGYDLERARALLEEAGKADRFEVKLATLTGDVNHQQMAVLWQYELNKIGVALKIDAIANAAWWDAAYNPDNDYDIMVINWAPGWPSPYEFAILFHSENSFTPFVGYANPAYDDMLAEALATEAADMAEANRLYTEAQQMLFDDAVAVYILDVPLDFVYRNDITGFRANPTYFDVVFWYQMRRP